MILLWIIIPALAGFILGWITKSPFTYLFLKRELKENMLILKKIQDLKDKKAVVK